MLRDERVLDEAPDPGLPRPRPGLQPALARARASTSGLERPHALRDRRPAACPRPGHDWIHDAAAGRARALAGRRADRARRVHDRGELPRLRLDRARRRPLRTEGALAAAAGRSSPPAPTSGSRSRSTSTPTSPISRRSGEHGWELLDPREVAGTPDRYAAFVRGSKAELGIAKEGYVVSRSGWFSDRSAALPRLRPAGGRAGHRLRRAAADRRGAVRVRRRRRRAGGDRGDPVRLRPPCAGGAGDRRGVPRLAARPDPAAARGRGAAAGTARARSTTRRTPSWRSCSACTPDALRRRPFEYRSSAPLVELEAGREDAAAQGSLAGRADRARARGEARLPPRPGLARSEVYRSLLDGAGLGTPALAAAVVDPEPWAVLARGREGGRHRALPARARALARGGAVARTAARPVRRHRSRPTISSATTARTSSSGRSGRRCVRRATRRSSTGSPACRRRSSTASSTRRTCSSPAAASASVDWELAGVGPGVLDLAALTSGLADDDAAALAETYRLALERAAGREGAPVRRSTAPDFISRSSGSAGRPSWTPPPEHARDWRAELPRLAERVGL